MEKFKNIVEFKRCKTAKLEFASDQSVCIDGELCEKRSIELKLLPLALKILIPKGCNFKEDESNAPEPLLTKA
jgi:diacylglycerol kinase family enzyme